MLEKSTDGSKALLVSEQVLDFKSFTNDSTVQKTWDVSDLRTWLNGEFYNKAFDASEKAAIKKETLVTSGSANTEDNVFVLSKNEANTLTYQMVRLIKPTLYAKNVSRGNLYIRVSYGRVWWWLRSAASATYTDIVNYNGEIGSLNGYDPSGLVGVRPAIYIDLTSPYFTANESNVTYNLDGGDWVKDNVTWKELNKYKEGVVNTLPTTNEIKKDGYELKGWYINGGDLLQTFINETWTGNLTLKAAWSPEGSRDLTDRENAAFIVRDEWTSWVKSFTNELSELDKNATSRIYSNMDFYDMQYRFTEKYKKVPEYLDEDGKPTQKLKDMIKEKRKEIAGGSNKIRDYLKFTSTQNGSTVKFNTNTYGSSTLDYDMGYSKDGLTFIQWNKDVPITLNAGEYIYVYNKTDTLSNDMHNLLFFNMTGSIEASGNIMSLLNFADEVPMNGFYGMFGYCSALTKAPELPAKKIGEGAYAEMFAGCTNLKEAPELPATTIGPEAYLGMFRDCTSLEKGPYIRVTSILNRSAFQEMFCGCTNLNYIKMDYTGSIVFTNWVLGVTATGDFYYNGSQATPSEHSLPTNFIIVPFTN
ncbi:MAG: InlB B-repeat-containing protein [Lachnospiraceae bacterium]|nr:InlB B-repeat-containing protein [Lachnospiraceae bacterium]